MSQKPESNANEAKSGRPAGSATKKRDVVDAVISVHKCPCGSDKPPKNKRLLRQGEATATVNGILTGSYKHYNAICADCGRAVLYREFRTVR